jgi:Zn-dependent oligopeptidase
MLENWSWQKATLKLLSKHHETSASLPEELIDSMLKAKNVHESLFMMRQVKRRVGGWMDG